MTLLPELITPTPVHEVLPGLWTKDESGVAEPYGGNKVRKLRSIFAEVLARGRQAVVTSGGVGSHHVYATAIYARANGLVPHAVLFAEPRTPEAERHGAGILTVCETVTVRRDPRRVALAVREVAAIHDAAVIAVGGSSVQGTLGWVDGGRELAEQIVNKELPCPRSVWVPSASGGTAVGLGLGLAASGVDTRVVAVRIGTFLTARRLRDLVARTRQRLSLAVEPGPIDLVEACAPLGEGPEELEPRYTRPAWQTCVALRDPGGPDVFVNTASRGAPAWSARSPPPGVDALFDGLV